MKRRQQILIALGIILALTVALWPRTSYAACDVNIGCYVDEGIVTVLRFLAQLGWFLNGNLLLVSRWIEEQRNWLIDDVMRAVFTGLLQGASVAWAEAVVIAIIIFIIGFSLRAVVEMNWVDLKRGIRNGVIALIVFTYGSQLMAASEQGRLLLSQAAAEMAKNALTTAGAAQMLTGGTSRPGDQMPPTATIYPGAMCGGVVPARASAGIMINDIAANYLFATAEDIHCPSETGAPANAPSLPLVFWNGGAYPTSSMGSSSGSVGFVGFYSHTAGEAADDEDRKRVVGLAMDGAVRQLFGIFLCISAVFEQIIQILFALGMVSLWFSLSISLVFALFVPFEGMMASIVRSGVDLIKQSVMTTIGVTLVGFVISTAASSSGVNAGLVAFIGLIALAVLTMMMVHTGRVIFATVSGMSSTVAGAAPAAVLGTLGGAGMLAGMALRGNAAGNSAAGSAREGAEAAARESGASDREVKQAGDQAARAAYSAALKSSAVQTFTDVGRAATDAAGFVNDPLRQSMRWQDRAEAERRQQEIIAAMDSREEPRADAPAASAPLPQPQGQGADGQSSSAAQRLRGLAPASAANPYTSPTTALGSKASGDAEDGPSPDERQADSEVAELSSALQRAQGELERVQQQLATAQGRASAQKPSALNEREIRRLGKEAEGVVSEVARLRQQLDEAERVQRQVRGEGEAQREQADSQRTWDMVQATEGRRDPVTGETPQLAIQTGVGLAQQQLDREQQRLDRRPEDDPSVPDDRAWLRHQQAAVGSLRRWNETLARPDTSSEERAAGEAAIRTIRDEAERDQQAAHHAGNAQREHVAGGVASLAGAMLPPAPAGVASEAALAPSAAAAPAGAGAPPGAASAALAPSAAAAPTGAPAPAGVASEAALAPSAAAAPAGAGAPPGAASEAAVAPSSAAAPTGAPAPAGAPGKGTNVPGQPPVLSPSSNGLGSSSAAAAPGTAEGVATSSTTSSPSAAPGIGVSASPGASVSQRLHSPAPAAASPAPAASSDAPAASPAPVAAAVSSPAPAGGGVAPGVAPAAVPPAPVAASDAPAAAPAPVAAPVASPAPVGAGVAPGVAPAAAPPAPVVASDAPAQVAPATAAPAPVAASVAASALVAAPAAAPAAPMTTPVAPAPAPAPVSGSTAGVASSRRPRIGGSDPARQKR